MRQLLLSLFVVFALSASAQSSKPQLRRLVVADIETHVPMRGVVVSTKAGYADTTNWRGICYVPVSFDTLSIAKSNYLTQRALPEELKDSTFLIPEGRSIGEVTVWGKNHIQDNVNEWRRYTPLPNGNTGLIGDGFDLAKMFDKRARRDRKHLQIVKGKFKEMEATDDPIAKAYNKVMEEKRREAEKKERERQAQTEAEKAKQTKDSEAGK